MLQATKARLAYSGISHDDLATQLQCSRSNVSHWLAGHRPMPDGMATRMGHAITRLERAEAAAQEARARSLAESALEATP